MKILIYIYCFPGPRGTEQVTTFLANEFVKSGNEVTVLSHISMNIGKSQFPLLEKVRVIHTPNSGFFSLINKRFIHTVIQDVNPDVIIFQDSTAPVAHNVLSSNENIPVVVCAHTVAYKYYQVPNSENGWFRYLIEVFAFPIIRHIKYIRDRIRRQSLYNKCWRYILLSNRMFGEFRAVARIGDSRKLRAIPNPIIAKSNRGIVETSNIKKNEIVFVGALNRGKGVDLLLEAWGMLSKKKGLWKLTIVGDGPARGDLQKLANSLGLRDVFFVGWDPDSTKYFRRAKILAFPSRGEGWGLVVTEAMAEGCVPIIMDSYSSAREIVDDGVNGVVVPAFDVVAFANRMVELMSDAEKLEHLSAGAREKVEFYKPEKVFKAWKQLLAELPQNYS